MTEPGRLPTPRPSAAPKSPDCPICGQPPMMVMGGGTQAFCRTDGCPVGTWNPMDSPETSRRTARQGGIRPSGETPGTPSSQEAPA